MPKFDDFDQDLKYDQSTFDIDSFQDNIRLKPDYYIHLCLQQLTRVFEGDVTDVVGFKKYVHLVGHIEILVRSAGLIPKNYDAELKKIVDSKKNKSLTPNESEAYIAREKLNLFISNVFNSGAARGPLYLYTNSDGGTSRQKETADRIAAKKELLKEEGLK